MARPQCDTPLVDIKVYTMHFKSMGWEQLPWTNKNEHYIFHIHFFLNKIESLKKIIN
jgi:hypothetical protein